MFSTFKCHCVTVQCGHELILKSQELNIKLQNKSNSDLNLEFQTFKMQIEKRLSDMFQSNLTVSIHIHNESD